MEGFLRQIESEQKSKIDFAMGDGEDFNRIIGWAISR